MADLRAAIAQGRLDIVAKERLARLDPRRNEA
jgi:hypothetical protein